MRSSNLSSSAGQQDGGTHFDSPMSMFNSLHSRNNNQHRPQIPPEIQINLDPGDNYQEESSCSGGGNAADISDTVDRILGQLVSLSKSMMMMNQANNMMLQLNRPRSAWEIATDFIRINELKSQDHSPETVSYLNSLLGGLKAEAQHYQQYYSILNSLLGGLKAEAQHFQQYYSIGGPPFQVAANSAASGNGANGRASSNMNVLNDNAGGD